MPMKSKAQRRYLWAVLPDVAERFERETPKGKRLPERVGKGKRSGRSKRRGKRRR